MLRSFLRQRHVLSRHVCQGTPTKLFHQGQARQASSQQPPKTANKEALQAGFVSFASKIAEYKNYNASLGTAIAAALALVGYLTYRYQREKDRKNSTEHQIAVVKNLFAQKLEFPNEHRTIHFENAELTDLLETGPKYLVLHGPSNVGKTKALEQYLTHKSGILHLDLRAGQEKETSHSKIKLANVISEAAGIQPEYVKQPVNVIVQGLKSVVKDVKARKEGALGPSPFQNVPVVWIEDLHRCTSKDGKYLDGDAEELMNQLVNIVKSNGVRILITISTKSGISILRQLSGTTGLMKVIHFPSPDVDALKAGLTDYLIENKVPTKFKTSEEGVVSEKDVAEELVKTYGTFMGQIQEACQKIIGANKANKQLNMEKLLEDTRMSIVEEELLKIQGSPEMTRLCEQIQHFEMQSDSQPVYGVSKEFLSHVEDQNQLIEVVQLYYAPCHVTLRNRLQAEVAREYIRKLPADTWAKSVVDHSGTGVAVAIGGAIVGTVMYYWN